MASLIQMLEEQIAARDRDRDTFKCYAFWTKKCYRFLNKPGSRWTGRDIERWMASLYNDKYSAKSRKQALNAIVFVFRHVLKTDLGILDLPPMPKITRPLIIVPTREEIAHIFIRLSGHAKLMAGIMYGSDLRVTECCKLRVKDIDFPNKTVRVHDGKGMKSRLCPLAEMMIPALRRHVAWRMELHERDIVNGFGFVELPGRLDRKYKNANRELQWQFLFPSQAIRNGYRWHTVARAVQTQMARACREARINKHVTPHTLRHAFATHALEAGNSLEWLREVMGHADLNTTALYLHADRAGGVSPLDARTRVVVPQPARISFDEFESRGQACKVDGGTAHG